MFDIDGVLCASQEALHYFLQKSRGADDPRWDDWFASIGEHGANRPWVVLAQMLHRSWYHIVLLTARPEHNRQITSDWLLRHQIWHHELVMRQESHSYEDTKDRNLAELVLRYQIELAIDDDKGHCEVYERYGIPTIHAATGFDAHYRDDFR